MKRRPAGGKGERLHTSLSRPNVTQTLPFYAKIRNAPMSHPIGPVARSMQEKLTAALTPTRLEIIDESHRHAGHAGVRTGPGHAQGVGETHFRLIIASPDFAGLSRLDRQRRVNAILADELAGPVHALALRCLTPDEVD